MTSQPIVDIVFCASSDVSTCAQLESDLVSIAEGAFSVRTVASVAELVHDAGRAVAAGAIVPLVFVDEVLRDERGLAALARLSDAPGLDTARRILIAEQPPEVTGMFDGVLTVPWKAGQLKSLVSRLVTEYFVEEAPREVDEVAEVVDVDVLSRAFVEVEERAQAATERLALLQRSFLEDRALSDDEVEEEMIAEIDRSLGNPRRVTVPSGTRILTAGEPVDGIRVVVSGRVHLTLEVDGREIVFHARTAGRVVGLNAIALSETTAFFNVDTVDETTFIPLTLEQFDDALRHSPTLAIHFVSVALRAMARRNQRSIELRTTVDRLAHDLERERDELADAIDRLNDTQARLVESEKLATLGQLAAGIGHELNNPAAVVSRAADFLTDDIEALTASVPGADMFVNAVTLARNQTPVSTRVLRQQTKQLAEDLGDEALARRLVRIGITTRADYEKHFRNVPDAEVQLDRMERFYRIGASIRNIDAAAERIVRLVGSVRSYARANQDQAVACDIRTGIEETLLLLGHELENVAVETTYPDEIPWVDGYPGELNQVWTNLITNAIQAMDASDARLAIDVSVRPVGDVEVAISDNGHGIAPENLERIFEPAFTTKAGRVEFGLGLGLQIVKDIVVRHRGSISVESEPGHTCFTVVLPASGTGCDDNGDHT
jgi:two-component system NtrC family sensor kinase